MSDQTITSLIEKLEGADHNDAWVFARDVHLALFGGSLGKAARCPKYTTSLDAALALAARVLPRWGWDIGYPARLGEHGGRPWADCWPPVEDGEVAPFRLGGPRPTPRHVNAATPALAVVASLLRAQSEARV